MIALRLESGGVRHVRPEEVRQVQETTAYGRKASRVLLGSGSEPRWITSTMSVREILQAIAAEEASRGAV